MVKCGKCKFWIAPGEVKEPAIIPYWKSYGFCNKITCADDDVIYMGGREDVKVSDRPKAYTIDASDYRSALHTMATFGCILGEEKDGLGQ